MPKLRTNSLERSQSERQDVSCEPPLVSLLDKLVNHLVEALDSSFPSDMDHPRFASWGDADYLYLEVRIPEVATLEADVCVHDDRVSIRIRRPGSKPYLDQSHQEALAISPNLIPTNPIS